MHEIRDAIRGWTLSTPMAIAAVRDGETCVNKL